MELLGGVPGPGLLGYGLVHFPAHSPERLRGFCSFSCVWEARFLASLPVLEVGSFIHNFFFFQCVVAFHVPDIVLGARDTIQNDHLSSAPEGTPRATASHSLEHTQLTTVIVNNS